MNWRNPEKYVWHDETSYSRSKPHGTKAPDCWTIYFDCFRLSVWKSRHEEIGHLCSAHGLIEFSDHQLKSQSGEGARIEAIDFIQSRIDKAHREMNENRGKVKP